MEENPLTTPRQSSAWQSKPSQPKPSCPSRRSKPQTGPDPSISMRTRSQQRTFETLSSDLLRPLTPEESKTRENNIAQIKHLREAIKKWNRKME